MSNRTVLVPVATSLFVSPGLYVGGQLADLGIVARSLVYYDSVYLYCDGARSFARVLEWFVRSGQSEALAGLVASGQLVFLNFRFLTATSNVGGRHSVVNIIEPAESLASKFRRHFLSHTEVVSLASALPSGLLSQIEAGVVDLDPTDVPGIPEESLADLRDQSRIELPLQHLSDVFGLSAGPRYTKVGAKVDSSKSDGWRVSLYGVEELSQQIGHPVGFTDVSGGMITANRIIAAARMLRSDLVLPEPMSSLVGDKLYEVAGRGGDRRSIGQFLRRVEFPDVAAAVRADKLSCRDVLVLRAETDQFRDWLSSSEKTDDDRLVAYHNETASALGLQRLGSSTLEMFGYMVSVAVSAKVGAVAGTGAGAAAGFGTKKLFDSAKNMFAPWRPRAFGTWHSRRIRRLVARRQRRRFR